MKLAASLRSKDRPRLDNRQLTAIAVKVKLPAAQSRKKIVSHGLHELQWSVQVMHNPLHTKESRPVSLGFATHEALNLQTRRLRNDNLLSLKSTKKTSRL